MDGGHHTLRRALIALAIASLGTCMQAQNIENQPIASQYGVFKVPATQMGSYSFSPASCQQSAGNRNFAAFSNGTPIKIVDADPALTEIVTPSSVYINDSQCVINVAPVNTHVPPFYLTSGTGGLQEALINSTNISGANTIVLDTLWHQLVGSGAAAIIAAAKGSTALGLVDVTTTPYVWYQWSGSAYAAVSVGGGTIPATSLVLKGSGSTGVSVAAVPGTDYVIPSGTVANATNAVAAVSATTATTAGNLTGNPTLPNGTNATTQSPCASNNLLATGSYVANCGSGVSQKVVYASKISGVTTGVAVVPGSSASGTTDSATALNAAIAGGNVDLEVDSGFALSTSLVLSSNTTIHCIAPQYGFILQASTNAAAVMVNAHQNSPTTSSGTGGFLPSNITDAGIKVIGCQVNANSTQATTGNNSQGTAHGATPGGLFTYALFFVGVKGLQIENNDIYDSGCWNTFLSNTLYARVINNYIHQPSPLVNAKFTDGVHFIGPDQYVFVQNNRINAGDDSIALNADDGNRTGSGDANASYVQTFLKWGPITDAQINDNELDAGAYGLRLYSATELIDRVFVTNLSGVLCGNTGIINALSALGTGNVGKINISGWTLQTTGTCNVFSVPYNMQTTANIQNLEWDDVSVTNPTVTWPMLTQSGGNIGILSLHNWALNTQTATFSNVISLSSGSVGQIMAGGLNWYDNSSNTGAFFSGGVVPGTLTCSGYAGPNRLLASGFAPGTQNGDCFTNIYPAATVTYVNTTFNEHTTGTALATTTPATCTNGCTGTWTASSGQPSSGAWQYSTNSATLSGSCTAGGADNFCPVYINAGTGDYTLRVAVSQFDDISGTGLPGLAFVVRWTDNNNFVTFLPNGGTGSSTSWGLYDVVSGSTTQIGSSITLGEAIGTWTVVMNGTSAKLTNPGGSFLSGTISGSNTSHNVGLSSNLSSFVGADIITSLSVKSN